MKKIIILPILIISSVIFSTSFADETNEEFVQKGIFKIIKSPEFFMEEKGGYSKYIIEANNELVNLYNLLEPDEKTVVIMPIFTQSAYSEGGFYDYFRGECGEECLETTMKIDYGEGYYSSSNAATQTLKILGYQFLTDLDVHRNPEILKNYEKIILLHNEYVTIEEFQAIRNHPNVIYLYPNALFGEIKYLENTESIKLIRGHGFPNQSIDNGFEWEFDNTEEEFDTQCINWKFYPIDNGIMLNCYPENLILFDPLLFAAIKNSDDSFWWNISEKNGQSINKTDYEEKLLPIFEKLPKQTASVSIKENESGGCLIATATFDSELSPQVQKLREIRDSKLLQTESGSRFMELFNSAYYSFSPIIADYERENPIFKDIVKVGITPMILTLTLMDNADNEFKVVTIGISLIIMNVGMYVLLPIFGIITIKKKF